MKNNLKKKEETKLQHLLSINELSKNHILEILELADSFLPITQRGVKKVPILRGKTIFNLFFESSTRTRTTFEIAAKRLSADVINLNIDNSAQKKGESLIDMISNLSAMHADMFVVRHRHSGASHLIAQNVQKHISVINAGDGGHSHPTQALLDMFTILKYKRKFTNLSVAIVGDILHSRVARSQIDALSTLGTNDIRVIGPLTLIPKDIESLGVKVFSNLRKGLKDVDVIIILRLQYERMRGVFLPSEEEYFRIFGLTKEKYSYAKKDAIIMHPGPINRGIEIDSEIADYKNSVILPQVSNGIAVRMAVMAILGVNK